MLFFKLFNVKEPFFINPPICKGCFGKSDYFLVVCGVTTVDKLATPLLAPTAPMSSINCSYKVVKAKLSWIPETGSLPWS